MSNWITQSKSEKLNHKETPKSSNQADTHKRKNDIKMILKESSVMSADNFRKDREFRKYIHH